MILTVLYYVGDASPPVFASFILLNTGGWPALVYRNLNSLSLLTKAVPPVNKEVGLPFVIAYCISDSSISLLASDKWQTRTSHL